MSIIFSTAELEFTLAKFLNMKIVRRLTKFKVLLIIIMSIIVIVEITLKYNLSS